MLHGMTYRKIVYTGFLTYVVFLSAVIVNHRDDEDQSPVRDIPRSWYDLKRLVRCIFSSRWLG